jgi:CPA1 family monovalent cation:H+ antiporter
VLALPVRREYLLAGVLAIPAVLTRAIRRDGGVRARGPRAHLAPAPSTVKLLTWSGLRGGLAVALSLALRDHLPARQADVILVMTYFVVVFSILVQALSMKPLMRRYLSAAHADR